MRGDHREPIAEGDDDRRINASQLRRHDQMVRHVDQGASVGAVVPMHAKQITRIGRVGVNLGDGARFFGEAGRRVGKIGDPRQLDPGGLKSGDVTLECGAVGDIPGHFSAPCINIQTRCSCQRRR